MIKHWALSRNYVLHPLAGTHLLLSKTETRLEDNLHKPSWTYSACHLSLKFRRLCNQSPSLIHQRSHSNRLWLLRKKKKKILTWTRKKKVKSLASHQSSILRSYANLVLPSISISRNYNMATRHQWPVIQTSVSPSFSFAIHSKHQRAQKYIDQQIPL